MVGEIKEKEGVLERLVSNIPGGLVTLLVTFDGNYKILYANDGFYALTGYTKETWEACYGIYAQNVVYPGDERIIEERATEVVHANQTVKLEFRALKKEGGYVWLALQARMVSYNEAENQAVFEASILDITSQKKIEEELFIQNQRYLAVEELSNDIICEYDIEQDTVYFPHRFAEHMEGNVVWHNFKNMICCGELIHREDKKSFIQAYQKLYKTFETLECEFRTNLFTEEYRWFGGAFHVVRAEDERPVKIVGKLVDIDEEKRRLIELENSTRIDQMTKLYNKNAIYEMAELKMAKREEIALFIVDIDNFKKINDTMGHLFGDSVICSVADVIKEVVRGKGAAGRIGGDEFMVILDQCDRTCMEKSAIDILRGFRKVYAGGKEKNHISGSIGIALFPQDGKQTEELFARADEAMYVIKNRGKNRFLFYDQIGRFEISAKGMEARSCDFEANWMRRPAENYSQTIISFAFSMLATAKNLPSAVNLILDRIGKHYELDRIQVMHANKTNRSMEVSYRWQEQVRQVDGEEICCHFSSWDEMLHCFDENGMIIVQDCRTQKAMADMRRTMDEMKAKALVSCGLYDVNGEFLGIVVYEDCGKTRRWRQEELDTFLEFAKILSYFLLTNASRKQDFLQIEKLSNYDKITGLYEYKQFKKDLERILRKKGTMGKLALLNMDISNFKYVNTTFGMESGDQLLQDFAKFFIIDNVSCISGCRIYADDFLAVIRMESKEELEGQLKQLSEDFIRQEYKKNFGNYFSIHTGIYEITAQDEDANYVIDCAIMARRVVKKSQERQYEFFDGSMRKQVVRESKVLAMIQNAINQEDIVPYLQPKFDLETNQIIGAEALVRWKQDGEIYFYPSDFIPILEKSGDIVRLDFSIYEQVLKIMRRWILEGRKLKPISVNISRIHCKFDKCDVKLTELADRYEIPHELIEIEITESAFLSDTSILMENLKNLRQQGFRVSIDDFGSGYSSLSIISQMPVDVIKMDQTFINKALDTTKAGCVVAAMISMAQNMNLEVICEGVETEEQAGFLLEHGCRMGQGYIFSKPVAIDEFEERYLQ